MLVSVLTAVTLVGTAAASVAGSTRTTGSTAQAPAADLEARRVDRVPTPTPEWFDCSPAFGPGNECTTVDLPLDYDKPNGPTTAVAVLRHPATDQANKIGSLFLNPGGPGGSGVSIAADAVRFLGPEVLEKFDIVGVDPRGIGFGDTVRCWRNMGEQAADLQGMYVPFPVTDDEETAFVASSKKAGQACARTGTPLAGSMSTAQVARDMDVVRRMVGDEQLTYLGFSYGSYLGNVYANMFPGRVRALVIDGVLDPVAWSGTRATQNTPVTTRLRSDDGSAKALDEILLRCEKAGPEYCRLSSYGDPQDLYAQIKAQLREKPVDIVDPETGEVYLTMTYPILVAFLLGDLYAPFGSEWVDMDLTMVWELLQEPAEPGTEAAARQEAARTGLVEKYRAQQEREKAAGQTQAEQRAALGFAFPYDNYTEAFLSVLCTDSRNPVYAESWRGHADRADRRAPDFGRLWTWNSAPCAQQSWTVRDEDAYTGPFTTTTANPVLVVGNYWDPATNYEGAVNAARLLPNSRLLSSDSWGHTAYGTSACVTDAVDTYLLDGTLPAEGTLCEGDYQPYTVPLESPEDLQGPQSSARSAQGDRLPPVVPPVPGALPRG